jgi:hypothetical protein
MIHKSIKIEHINGALCEVSASAHIVERLKQDELFTSLNIHHFLL